MKRLIVSGGKRLVGRVDIQGSKNAALPIIFATISMRGISEIENVPHITDIEYAIEILKELGAEILFEGSRIIIDTRVLEYRKPNPKYVNSIRASTYLIGSCLARFGEVELMDFGGCNFGNRPIDMHIYGAELLGAEKTENVLRVKKLRGGRVCFDKISVGATVNTLLLSACAEGVTEIINAAKEPHILNLVEFLRSAGALIEETADGFLVTGRCLYGGKVKIIPDMIEAGTYLLLGPMTDGEIQVASDITGELDSFLSVLDEAGVGVFDDGKTVTVRGAPKKRICVKTAPYPHFPTDLQPQMAPLMAKGLGGIIEETVWEGRFAYLCALAGFGVESSLFRGKAEIFPSQMCPAHVTATDLRGGAACLLCALCADGESEIQSADKILRGYEQLIEKLNKIGANAEIV